VYAITYTLQTVMSSGNAFIDNHANKGSRRYRYYIEDQPDPTKPTVRLPATEIENAVTTAVVQFLRDRSSLLSNLRDLDRIDVVPTIERAANLADQLGVKSAEMNARLRALLQRVVYRENTIEIRLGDAALRHALGVFVPAMATINANYQDDDAAPIALNAPLTARRRGRQLRLVIGGDPGQSNPDMALITAVARAQALVTGEATSITEIAAREGVSPTYVSQLLPIGFLAPSIAEKILAGYQVPTITADRLIRRERLKALWSEQQGAIVL
jgi:site-specific DNA recombinase